jgi:hypothetical protein
MQQALYLFCSEEESSFPGLLKKKPAAPPEATGHRMGNGVLLCDWAIVLSLYTPMM